MKRLILECWLRLAYVDLVLGTRSFTAVHETVRNTQVRSTPAVARLPYAELCRAVDLACVFYFKRVLCLQRSAATTCLLRRHGWHADMVIGVQMLPFRSHAWVEVDDTVVNDKSYVQELYSELERC
jgi:hypothetical protein